ncbi:MAG: hypothetical protein PHE48_01340 [Candidatus Daviesbacteria bacterium]|nr:hypothetical protein [Candidatus Daviesbacteria bacterium]
MITEFNRGPQPVSLEHQEVVERLISFSKVANAGYFDEYGVFGLVPTNRPTTLENRREYWTLDLLEFTSAEDRLWIGRKGLMVVFGGRVGNASGMEIEQMAAGRPRHILTAGDVREINPYRRFEAVVPESGWLFSIHAALRQRLYAGLRDEDLEKILMGVEVGKEPPFFDDHIYTKVEPGHEGKRVQVLPFHPQNDAVVIDTETRKLIPVHNAAILSEARWTKQ